MYDAVPKARMDRNDVDAEMITNCDIPKSCKPLLIRNQSSYGSPYFGTSILGYRMKVENRDWSALTPASITRVGSSGDYQRLYKYSALPGNPSLRPQRRSREFRQKIIIPRIQQHGYTDTAPAHTRAVSRKYKTVSTGEAISISEALSVKHVFKPTGLRNHMFCEENVFAKRILITLYLIYAFVYQHYIILFCLQ
jgi:hypothetical protein